MREKSIQELLGGLEDATEKRREAARLVQEARAAESSARSALRSMRVEAGLTQSDVANAMGVSKAYVSAVETGYSASASTLTNFAQAITERGTDGSHRKQARAQADLAKARGEAQDD